MEKNEIEKLTQEYQILVEQLQSLAIQKEQFEMQKNEENEAMEELEKATGKIYFNIGGALVEMKKEDAIKKLKEKQESTEMRLTIASKQYNEYTKKEKELREKINSILK
ncbi:MAG: prefoldin subunit [Candidatus Micrarchaeia archaeon]